MAKIRVKRGTLAQLDAAGAAATLAAGEPYLVTDLGQLAVGLGADHYTLVARDRDLKYFHALGSLGAAVTIDLANGYVQRGDVNANVTISLPTLPTGVTGHLTLLLYNSGGPWSITVSTVSDGEVGLSWVGGVAPELDMTPSERNVLVFRGAGGQRWIGDGGSA